MATIHGTNNSFVDEIIGFSIILIIFFLFRSIILTNFRIWLLAVLILVGMILGGVLSALISTTFGLEEYELTIEDDVEKLDLSGRSLITINLEDLPELDKLRVLNLEDNLLKKIDFAPFRKHPSLENLDVSNNELEVVDLTVLRTCSMLQRLDLRNNPIDSIEAADLLKLKQFSELLVDPNTKLTVDGVSLTQEQFHEMIEQEIDDVDKFLTQEQ